jgi:general secretion pathway protein A
MYEGFYGLNERPFDLTPNPRFLLLTGTHREALSNLEYGISGRKGLTLLIGDAGTGKTTVVRTALARWDEAGHKIGYINNPTLTRDEFVESLVLSFGLGAGACGSKTRFLAALTELVMSRHKEGLITGLLIDEAQSLSNELLEEVRLLANIETVDEKVFPVVLAGQPELATRLNQPELRQIKQRIALRYVLQPLDVREAAAYIAGRIQIAGGVCRNLFTREAVVAIHEYSAGIPRVINVICDNVLLSAFASGRGPATREVVAEVCRDFDLERQAEGGLPEPVTFEEAPQEVGRLATEREVEILDRPVAIATNAGPDRAAEVPTPIAAGRGLREEIPAKRRFWLFSY